MPKEKWSLTSLPTKSPKEKLGLTSVPTKWLKGYKLLFIYRIDHLYCIVLSSIGGTTLILTERLDKMSIFGSINYRFQSGSIHPQELVGLKGSWACFFQPFGTFFGDERRAQFLLRNRHSQFD